MMKPRLRDSGKRIPICLIVLVALLAACADDGAKRDRHMQAANEYLDTGQLIEALIELKSAAQLAPDSVEVRSKLATTQLTLGDGPAAVKEAEAAKRLGLSRELADELLIKALIAARNGSEALGVAEQLQADIPSPEHFLLVADAKFASDDHAGAEEIYGESLDIDADNIAALVGLAKTAMRDGNVVKAENYASSAIERDADNMDALIVLGNIANHREDSDAALVFFEKAVASAPFDISPQLAHLAALVHLNKASEAQVRIGEMRTRFRNLPILNYFEGVNYHRQEKLQEAQAAFRLVLSRLPEHPPSNYFMGVLMYQAGSYEQAAQHLEIVSRLTPQNKLALRLLASVQLRIGRSEDAKDTIESLERSGPLDAALTSLKGRALLLTGESEQGIAALQQAAALAPTKSGFAMDLVLAHLERGQTGDVLSLLDSNESLEKGPTTAALAAIAHFRGKDWAQAIEVCESYLREAGPNEFILNILGVAQLRAGNEKDARKSFQAAIEKEPQFVLPLQNIVAMDFRAAKYQKIPEGYEQLRKLTPDSELVLSIASESALQNNNVKEALEYLERAREIYPNALGPRLRLVNYYLRLNANKRAFDIAKEAVAIAPEDKTALLSLIKALLSARKFDQADALSKQILDKHGDSAEAHYHVAMSKLGVEQKAAARKHLRRAHELAPEHSETMFRLGSLLVELGEYDEAIKTATKLGHVAGQEARMHFVIGNAREGAGSFSDALVAFETSFKLSPTRESLFKVVSLKSRLGRAAEALRDAETWLSAHESDSSVRLVYAQALERNGQVEKAAQEYRKILSIDPRNLIALNNISLIGIERGERGAISDARTAYEVAPNNPAILDTYGWALVQLDEVENGVEILSKAIELAPDVGDIRYHYAVGLAKAGDREGALREIKRALDSRFEGSREKAEKLLSSLNI